MTGFEVDPESLRSSADAARQAAGVVRELELGQVAELAVAMPGTDAAGTATGLGPHWVDACARWTQGMDSYASALTSAANDYQERDNAAARGFGGAGAR